MNILKWIKGWRLDKALKSIFTDANNEELKDVATKAVILVNNFKNYVDHPGMNVVTALIPGDWDNATVNKVKKVLPVVINGLASAGPCIAQQSWGKKVECIVALVKVKEDNEKAKFWHGLASSIGAALSDGKLTISDLFLVIEPIFRQLKTK